MRTIIHKSLLTKICSSSHFKCSRMFVKYPKDLSHNLKLLPTNWNWTSSTRALCLELETWSTKASADWVKCKQLTANSAHKFSMTQAFIVENYYIINLQQYKIFRFCKCFIGAEADGGFECIQGTYFFFVGKWLSMNIN